MLCYDCCLLAQNNNNLSLLVANILLLLPSFMKYKKILIGEPKYQYPPMSIFLNELCDEQLMI